MININIILLLLNFFNKSFLNTYFKNSNIIDKFTYIILSTN